MVYKEVLSVQYIEMQSSGIWSEKTSLGYVYRLGHLNLGLLSTNLELSPWAHLASAQLSFTKNLSTKINAEPHWPGGW